MSDPNYATAITRFIQTTVPDTFNSQQVNFRQYFTNQGGLAIWGAPISNPQVDPQNSSFIDQRFQRGIMHYIGGTGTQSVLLTDYLRAIMTNQNIPQDRRGQATTSRFYSQYCPNSPLGLCRPGDLQGADLTSRSRRDRWR
jgi:hypothetical protein